ncbi:DUF2804 domain-containing protein [Microvirga antarctica]|uniref:DUF2804 domain-containing protein n=1 Tax=Microvirga antarctica TaxID=2819233 RepID=UPI001B313628|nr:DUF2804 domain-containing protein [Microvirga antarctica]
MVGGVIKVERELTSQVDLCLPDGTLNPEAVGWTRSPLHRANLRGWGRNKRFEYWCIATPDLVVAVNVSHSDYRVTLATFFLDLRTLEAFSEAEIHWLPRSKVDKMPDRSGGGPVIGRGNRMAIEMLPTKSGVRLVARTSRLHVDLDVIRGAQHESMSVVVPWDTTRFQYTCKDNCLPVRGTVTADGVDHIVDEAVSYATLDHGRGRWPYSIVWNWGSASGRSHGHEIGLQLGAKWTDGTPSTENALRIDGRIEKISQELKWTYDRTDWLRPWTIRGERIDLVFTPVYDRQSSFDRLVVISKEHQCFGYFNGHVIDEAGRRLVVERLFGWAEEVHRRW